MKWTVLLLAIQLALAVTSPLFTDPHRTAPEPEEGGAYKK